MAFMDVIRRIFGEDDQAQPQNRLASAGVPLQPWSAEGLRAMGMDDYASAAPSQFRPGVATAPVAQAGAAASPAPAATAPAGGGGGFLQNMFNPGGNIKNRTLELLKSDGIDEGTATLMMADRPTMQKYLLGRSQGAKPIEVNGRLVDPRTYKVLADFSTPQNRQTTTIDGKLVDTNTGKVIGDYGGDEKLTDDIREWQFAVKNGQFDGTFTDWQTKGVRQQGKDFGNLQDVRKEIQALPSYKNFSQAAPIYKTMVDASSRDSKAADLNLVYGLGKIFDPNSVVREGEMVMVKDTASLPDWLVGAINSLNGGARLQGETRAAILREAQSRMGAYKDMLGNDLKLYRRLAETYKLDPELLLPPLPDVGELPELGTGAPKANTTLPLPPTAPAPAAPVPTAPTAPTAPVVPAPGGGVTDWQDWLAPGRKR